MDVSEIYSKYIRVQPKTQRNILEWRIWPVDINEMYYKIYCQLCFSFVSVHILARQTFVLHEIRKRKANWIGYILRRNCLLQQVIEGKIKGQIEVTRRRRRRRKKLQDDLKGKRGYCQLKEEALDRTMWRNRFGRGFGRVVWQITDDDDDDDKKITLIRAISYM